MTAEGKVFPDPEFHNGWKSLWNTILFSEYINAIVLCLHWGALSVTRMELTVFTAACMMVFWDFWLKQCWYILAVAELYCKSKYGLILVSTAYKIFCNYTTCVYKLLNYQWTGIGGVMTDLHSFLRTEFSPSSLAEQEEKRAVLKSQFRNEYTEFCFSM